MILKAHIKRRSRRVAWVPLLLARVTGLLSFWLITINQSAAAELSAKQIYNDNKDSIVVIYALDDEKDPTALGTGFFIADGNTIVTNYHVVKDANSWVVKLSDGGSYPVIRVIAADRDGDIAIIEVKAKRKPLRLSTTPPEVGDPVAVIGHPLGYENTLSVGIVSSTQLSNGYDFQISAPISPGNSGGPVFSMQGTVVGIASAIRRNAQNLNFAQSVRRLAPLLAQAQTAKLGIASDVLHTDSAKQLVGDAASPVNLNDSLREKLIIENARIRDLPGAAPGLELTLLNESHCAVSGVSVLVRLKQGANKDDPFVYQTEVELTQVIAPGTKVISWHPIAEASGHGDNAPVWNRWFGAISVVGVGNKICPKE